MRNRIISIFSLFILTAAQVFASGFQINEHGARSMGLAGAFTGLANDPTAVYFNPAGITQLSGLNFSIGATYISPFSKFTGPVPSTTESKLKDQFFTPANFYATYSLGNLAFGFGFNSPYGLGTKWDDNWVGKYKTTETEIRTFNFSPVVAYKFSEALSASVGFTVSYADVLIARKAPVMHPQLGVYPDASIELKGDDLSFGYSAGLLYKVNRALSFGLAFHSQIKYEFKGTATTTFDPSTPAPFLANPAYPKGDISAPLTTPMNLTVGGAYRLSDATLVSADFQYNGWSSYDKLAVTFANGMISSSIRDYKNSFIARAGAEHTFNNTLALRGGVLFDKNPVKDERLDPTLPDADRLGLNLGFSYKITKSLSVDVAYMYLYFLERTINNSQELISVLPASPAINGTYNSSANLLGLNFSYGL